MSDYSEVLSVMSSLLDIIEDNTLLDKQLIGKGNFGSVYCLSVNGISWVEKEMKLFSFDLKAQNLREANYLKWFPKNKYIMNPYNVYIKEHKAFCDCGDCAITKSIVVSMPLKTMDLACYIDNTTISDRFSNFRKIFSQVCLGLSYLHCNNLVHADLKSTNILLDIDTLHINIIDFSLVFEINNSSSNVTTSSYCAPEIFTNIGQKKYGPHNDIWSLGIVMLEFLTGENRMEGLTSTNIAAFVNREKPYPVKRFIREANLNPDSPEVIFYTELIERMLTRKFEDRLTLSQVYFILCSKKLPTSVRKYPSYIFYESDSRINAIKKMHSFVTEHRDSIKYSFELGVNICDRYCYKTREVFNDELLNICLYIATCFLTDDGRDGEWENIFFGRINKSISKKIVDVIKVLDFDIYRPTFYSYVKKTQYVDKVARQVIFEMMGDITSYRKSYKELYNIFLDLMIEKTTPNKKCRYEKEKLSDLICRRMDVVF